MTGNDIEHNLLLLKKTIVPYIPNIIAVTKYYGIEAIEDAYSAGLRDFAESRAMDAQNKIENLDDEIKNNSTFHFIGHLQTNKAEIVVKYFDYIHSVDSIKLTKAISESAKKMNKTQKILLQINISEEVQKFGFSEKELFKSFDQIIKLENLEICGLMCMTPLGADDNELDRIFMKTGQIKIELNEIYNLNLRELSMGMSNDYKVAIKHGATMIRIGRKLFNKSEER